MAEYIRYVNGASTGGDGTTSGLSGSTAAYITLSACEAAERVDLVAATDNLLIECAGATDDTATVTFNTGWTTDATYHVTIHGDLDWSLGRIDTAAYLLIQSANNRIVDCRQVVHWKNIQISGPISTPSAECILFGTGSAGSTVDKCIMYGQYVGINPSANITVTNTLMYDNQQAGINNSSASTVTVNNCVVYNCGYRGIYMQGTAITCTNVVVAGSTNADYAGVSGGSNNADSDASAPGTSPVNSITVANEFVSVTGGSENFHIVDSGVLYQGGTDASLTTDVDGDTWHATTPSIGIDEVPDSSSAALFTNHLIMMNNG